MVEVNNGNPEGVINDFGALWKLGKNIMLAHI